jgi:hypothetical protein
MNKLQRTNFVIYFFLFLGYLLFNVYELEYVLYPKNEKKAKSNTQFVYQQF